MKVQFKGRIDSMVKNNDKFLTIINTPAVDTYSQPASYKIASDNQLGQPGDEILIDCEMKGYVKRKPYTEKNTGIQKVFWEGNVIFDFLKVSDKPLQRAS